MWYGKHTDMVNSILSFMPFTFLEIMNFVLESYT